MTGRKISSLCSPSECITTGGEGSCIKHSDCPESGNLFCAIDQRCLPCRECHRGRDSVDGICESACGTHRLGSSLECLRCFAHSDCPHSLPFCYGGMCSVCEDCVECEDGVDFTCGPCEGIVCNPPTAAPTSSPTVAPLLLDMPEPSFPVAGIDIVHVILGLAVLIVAVLTIRQCEQRRRKKKSTSSKNARKESPRPSQAPETGANPFSSSNYYKDNRTESQWQDQLSENTIAVSNPTSQFTKKSMNTDKRIKTLNDTLRKASTSQIQRKMSQKDAIERKKSGQRKHDFDNEALRKASGFHRASRARLLESAPIESEGSEISEPTPQSQAVKEGEIEPGEIMAGRVKFKV